MDIQDYHLPDELYYTRDHAWVRVEGGRLRIGITDVMQKLAGGITFIRLPREGKAMEEGKTLASLQSGKWAGKIVCPMAAVVVEANRELTTNPGLMNSSPYGDGWIAVVEPADLEDGLKNLLSGSDVEPWLLPELEANAG